MRMKIITYLGLMVLLAADFAGAHGLATSQNKIIGNYFIEFEYGSIGNVNAGEFESYYFDILNPETKEFLGFGRAFVKIAKKGQGNAVAVANLFSLDLFGPGNKAVRIGAIIPDQGDYTAEVIFYDQDEKEIVDAAFDFTVDPPYLFNEDTSSNFKLYFLAALIIGIIIGIFIYKFINDVKQNKSA